MLNIPSSGGNSEEGFELYRREAIARYYLNKGIRLQNLMQGTHWKHMVLRKTRTMRLYKLQGETELLDILEDIKQEDLLENETPVQRLISDENVKTVNCPMVS